jgi:hypothetical protein
MDSADVPALADLITETNGDVDAIDDLLATLPPAPVSS